MSGIPVVFTQEQIDEMARKPFDVYDNHIRKNMASFQEKIDEIKTRNEAREAAFQKWKSDDSTSNQTHE
jgi:hypothetical protein